MLHFQSDLFKILIFQKIKYAKWYPNIQKMSFKYEKLSNIYKKYPTFKKKKILKSKNH